jgi:protein-L-isoaspartate(D-aspartate) O-methyltransferase
VHAVVGDGSQGYAPDAPYAGIVVAAAAPRAPQPLLEQLADDGRLVVPIGPRDHQQLTVVHRRGNDMEHRVLEPCVFVPLVGRYGQH